MHSDPQYALHIKGSGFRLEKVPSPAAPTVTPQGVTGGALEGLQLNDPNQVVKLQPRLISGSLDGGSLASTLQNQTGVILGQALAQQIGAQVGSRIELVIPFAQQGEPRVVAAHVIGLVSLGVYEYDLKYLYAPLTLVQELIQKPGQVSTMRIKVDPQVSSKKVADRLSEGFGYPFRVKDWSVLHSNLFAAIELEKKVIAIILAGIILVASFNVISTLMMMTQDKGRDLAILKSMGFKPQQTFWLFCFIGTGIGLLGGVMGLIGGLILNVILAKTQLIHLPASVYYLSYLPVKANILECASIVGFALLLAFLASVIPALRIASKSPIEGIRYE
jgi:lipoprotein-releasing system permease protein